MNMNKTFLTSAVLVMAAVLAVAGCGGDDNGGGGYGSKGGSGESSSPKPASSPTAVVSVASVPGLGKVIVDSRGFTLYDFHKDKGTKSTCYGGCAKVWPPLTTGGTPKAQSGALASKLATTQRDDGTTQVVYAGHPLYTYTADTKPGDAKGNDFSSFGAEWYALQPNGEEPED
jgi:predicted lipoprotein with Yx(FWY)xxD motif